MSSEQTEQPQEAAAQPKSAPQPPKPGTQQITISDEDAINRLDAAVQGYKGTRQEHQILGFCIAICRRTLMQRDQYYKELKALLDAGEKAAPAEGNGGGNGSTPWKPTSRKRARKER